MTRRPACLARIFSMTASSSPRTMFQKIWDNHIVLAEAGKQTILYIDLQLVHEVTSAQAFEGLRLTGRKVRRPEKTVATPPIGRCRSPIRSVASRSKRCAIIAESSACVCTT
jgi:homoaconitase/3-isopropylmalate dehydratase large subunit